MKTLAMIVANKVLSRVLFFCILFGGIVIGASMEKMLGHHGGRWDSLTMLCPAVLFAVYAGLRFSITRTFSLGTVIWSALLFAFGIIILVKG